MLTLMPVGATEFEAPDTILAIDVIPKALLSSAVHRVEGRVKVDENFLQFELNSDFGLFDITSVALLELRAHELNVLSQAVFQYERLDGNLGLAKEPETFRTADGAGMNTLSALRGSGSHLSSTLADNDAIFAPRQTTRRYSPEIGLSSGHASGSAFESHRRNVAYHLRLDPYSTNPHVQRFLSTIADARARGRFGAGSGILLRRSVSTTRAVEGGRIDLEVAKLVRHLEPMELKAGLEDELSRIGVTPKILAAFFAHQGYTLSGRARMAAHVDYLSEVAGRSAVFSSALSARSEAEALSFEQYVRMLAVYHQDVGRLSRLNLDSGSMPEAVREDGGLVLVLPVDYFYWTQPWKKKFDAVGGTAVREKTGDPPATELVVRGSISVRARKELAKRGVLVRERFLALR